MGCGSDWSVAVQNPVDGELARKSGGNVGLSGILAFGRSDALQFLPVGMPGYFVMFITIVYVIQNEFPFAEI